MQPPPTAYRPRLSYNEFDFSDDDEDLEDAFFTPNTSPRTSMASSLLMFPTGRKPSRRSLRLSDASDTIIPSPPSTPTATAPIPPVPSTRTPTQKRHPTQRNIHSLSTASSLSAHSLEPHSVLSDYNTTSVEPDLDKGKGVTKRTRHGLVTIPTTTIPSESAKSTTTTTSKRKNGDVTKDAKRSATLPPNGSAIAAPSKRKNDGDVTKDTKRSSSSPPTSTTNDAKQSLPTPPITVSSTSNGSTASMKPIVSLPPRRSSKSTSPDPTASSKEKTTDTDTFKTKEKGKEVDPSPPSKLRMKDKGKQRAKSTPASTPHTFSAFTPLPTPLSVPPANENANTKPSLPPAGFSFPPPPPHSPQQQQPQQPKNSLNGSSAAYTYAQRQKASSSPKPGGVIGSGSLMMNMAALLEEDEEGGEGNTPTRRLRRVPNGGGSAQRKGKEKRISDSTSESSHLSFAAAQSNANSLPPNSHSEGSTFRTPPKTLTSEVNAMSLPTPGDLPSKGTQGYTSLVLPRAPLPLGLNSSVRSASTSGSGSRKWFGNIGKEGKVDLTRSGVAQTTMASVEVVRGLGRRQGQNGLGGKLMGMLRRRTVSGGAGGGAGPRPIEGLESAKVVNEDPPTKKAAGVEGTVLGFTSYRKPPSYVPSSSVLVQVWAVGVDGVDGRLVGVNFGDHIWREGGYEDEDGMETEREEVRRGEESEEVDVSRSTPQQGTGLSGLGRSLSLKMSRKQRGSVGPAQQQDFEQARARSQSSSQNTISRSFSLKRNNTSQSSQTQHTLTKTTSQKRAHRQKMQSRVAHRADVGYIPGRSFVGRVLECGWDVREQEIRKGEWVVGLLDVKKCGALTEFIVVDRHRIHRVPHPGKSPEQQQGNVIHFQDDDDSGLTLEELALLPLCGIPAYRAVRTFIYAFSSLGEGGSMALPISAHDRSSRMTATEHLQDRRRRVLVLRGHDGAGAMAVQLLAKRGWKVSVHVPFSASSTTYDPTITEADHIDPFPRNIQERARDWGADEIIFDEEVGDGIDDGRIAAIRVIESLREDGDVFDAILDTVGGKEVREAAERLLRSAGNPASPTGVYGGFEPPLTPRARDKAKGVGQFTTLVGDVPERPIPTTADHFRAGLRSFGAESGGGGGSGSGARNDEGTADMKSNKVGYAWVGVAQDVDWEGEDISETLGSVLRLALEERVRPVIGARYRVVPFEQAPYVFVDRGPLGHGCNVVVKIAG